MILWFWKKGITYTTGDFMAGITVSKRGNVWQYRFDISKIGGKRKQVSKSGFGSRQEAVDAGIKALNEYQNTHFDASGSSIKLKDFLDLWFNQTVVPRVRPSTQTNIKIGTERYIKPFLGEYLLKDLTPAVILQYTLEIKKAGFTGTMQKFAVKTLKAALQYATDTLRYLPSNPAESIKFTYKISECDRDLVLTPQDIKAIFQRFPEDNRWHLPMMIALHTGLRIGEVFALTWDDVNLNRKTITVTKTVTRRTSFNKVIAQRGEEAHPWFLGPPKTKSSNRTVYIGDTLFNLLKQVKEEHLHHKEQYGEDFLVMYLLPKKNDNAETVYKMFEAPIGLPMQAQYVEMVCSLRTGKYVAYSGFAYCSRLIKLELGLPFSFHCLRHTHATYLIQAGVNIKAVQTRLGHSSSSTTLDIYTHATERMETESVQTFERYMKSALNS